MNERIKSICVFASSSNNIDKSFFEAANEMGKVIASNGYNVVFGGSNLGLMGEVTNSAKNFGSKIIGVMPEKLHNLGIHPGVCTEFIVTKGMRERKAKMDELSECIIALAGGFGTLEELSEMLTQKQLCYNNKPIILLNTNGFYNDLINFFNKIIECKFAPEITKHAYFIANTPLEAIEYINNYDFKEYDYLSKIKSIKR